MTENNFTYTVRCNTCRSQFDIQLFESHEKNLFLVDKKEWYCEACKKKYFSEQTRKLTTEQQMAGFPQLEGTERMISWAVKIRGELINKVDYLKKSLRFETEAEKMFSEKAFSRFYAEWHEKTAAKWWIDNRKMTVRDISRRLSEIQALLQKEA